MTNALLSSIIFILFLNGCDSSKSTPASMGGPAPKPPVALAEGEKYFNGYCAPCHGAGARGTDRGPTFLSKIYEPNHHGDPAFRLAAQNGVRAHHWNFGDMPKIEGVRPEEIDEIIRYVRWLQKEAGII